MDLPFSQDITLEDDRVLLRPLRDSDFSKLLPFSENEPTLWAYSLSPANGSENLRKYLDAALVSRENQTAYPFIVYDKKVSAFAGSTRFYDYQPIHRTTQLGFTWYGKDFQRTGLNRHCKWLMLSYAFDTLGLERVEFRADSNNARSITAMKSLGCTVEGILRNHSAGVTGRRDSIVLSILKSEWESVLRAKLIEKIQRSDEQYA